MRKTLFVGSLLAAAVVFVALASPATRSLRHRWAARYEARHAQARRDSVFADPVFRQRMARDSVASSRRVDSMTRAQAEVTVDLTGAPVVVVLFGDSLVWDGRAPRPWREDVRQRVEDLGWEVRVQDQQPVSVRLRGQATSVLLPARVPSAGALVGVAGTRWSVYPVDSLRACSLACWRERVQIRRAPRTAT